MLTDFVGTGKIILIQNKKNLTKTNKSQHLTNLHFYILPDIKCKHDDTHTRTNIITYLDIVTFKVANVKNFFV